MDDPDAVKRLLDGNIEPSEIEGNPSLYALAERIYGREGLEGLGVFAPEIETPATPQQTGDLSPSVSLPDFQPELGILKSGEKEMAKGKTRLIPLTLGVLGILGVGFNVLFGGGSILCSIGMADMNYICNPEYGNTRLVWTEAYSWEKLHTVDAWAQPMGIGMADGVLLALFSSLALIGFFVRKKSVHTGDMLPPLS